MTWQIYHDWLNPITGWLERVAYVFESVKWTKRHGVQISNPGRRVAEARHSFVEFISEMMRVKESGYTIPLSILQSMSMLQKGSRLNGEVRSRLQSILDLLVKPLSMHNKCVAYDG
tara:strand:+ start:86 stop:433 length:348 start_codon:yes stop_codon:yes gene_type:complete